MEDFERNLDLVKQLRDALGEIGKGDFFKGIFSGAQDLAEVQTNITQSLTAQQAILAQHELGYATLTEEKEKELRLRIQQLSNARDAAEQLQQTIALQSRNNDQLESWKNSVKNVKNILIAIAKNPMTWIIAGAIKLGKILWDRVSTAFSSIRDATMDVWRNMGATVGQSAQFALTTASAMFSIEGILYGTQHIATASKDLMEYYGGVDQYSRSTVLNLAKIERLTGTSGTEAIKLMNAFDTIGSNSTDMVESLSKAKGIAPGAVMKSIASSTQIYATNSKEGLKGLVNAAIEAKKLGMELKDVEAIGSSLLNIESSLEAELEAQLALGRQINLDKAREYALMGDQEGLMREIKNQGLTFAEVSGKNVIEQDMIAGALGMQRETLLQNLQAAEHQNEQSSALEKTWGKISGSVSQVGGSAIQVGAAMAPLLVTTKELGFSFKGIGTTLKGLGKSVIGLIPKFLTLIGLKKAAEVGGGTTDVATQAATSAGPERTTGGMTGTIEKIKPGKLLAGAASLAIVAGAVFVFAKAVQEFMTVSWDAVGKAVVSMLALVSAVALIGYIMMSGVGAIAILAGAAAMLIMAGAVFVLGKAIQEIGKGFAMFTPALLALAPMAMEIVALSGAMFILGSSFLIAGISMLLASPGFIAMGASLMVFAAGLAAVAPFLYVAQALGLASGGFGPGGEKTEEKDEGTDRIVSAINDLGARIENRPLAVYLGDKFVGEISSTQNVTKSFLSKGTVR